jgi:flagellar protein FlgJ
MHLRPATAQPLSTTDAPRADRSRLEHAAQQLEAQFAQMLVKSMRSASFGDPLMGDNSTYRDMYDQQLSRELAKGRGLGLAPMIVQQLERSTGAAGSAGVATPEGGFPIDPAATGMSLSLTPSRGGVSLPGVAAPALPRMDTPPVEQAALETGWGRRLANREGGATSHNLFGIKAGSRWGGERVSANTHEYVGGTRVSERATFRAYDSVGASFDDYARLLGNPRYAQARAAGTDTRQFAQALQSAGYATDPAYAAKINAIAEGATLNRALASLDAGSTRG